MLKYLVFTYYKYSPADLKYFRAGSFQHHPLPTLGLAQCSGMGSGPSAQRSSCVISLEITSSVGNVTGRSGAQKSWHFTFQSACFSCRPAGKSHSCDASRWLWGCYLLSTLIPTGTQRHVAGREGVPPKEGRLPSFYAFALKRDSKFSFRKGQLPCKHPCGALVSAGRIRGCQGGAQPFRAPWLVWESSGDSTVSKTLLLAHKVTHVTQ